MANSTPIMGVDSKGVPMQITPEVKKADSVFEGTGIVSHSLTYEEQRQDPQAAQRLIQRAEESRLDRAEFDDNCFDTP